MSFLDGFDLEALAADDPRKRKQRREDADDEAEQTRHPDAPKRAHSTNGRVEPLPGLGAPEPKKVPVTPPPPQTEDDRRVHESALDAVNHLLWHKALIDEKDDGSRLDEYISLVRASEKGEHLTIRDDFDKSIAIAFELVLQEHLNPWKIDLAVFTRMYLKRAHEENLELSTAGRIILMAWTVLRLQSDAMLELAERLAAPEPEPEPEFLDWGDIGDWDYEDEDFEYTQRVKHSPSAPIDEKVRRRGASRKVTLMELVDAFEEVRREADERKRSVAERARMKKLLAQSADDSVHDMMHDEDPEVEQNRVWDRILNLNGAPIRLDALHDHDLDSFVAAFNSVLFLAAERRIDLWQEDFPWGPIMLRNRMFDDEEAADEVAAHVERGSHEGPHPPTDDTPGGDA